MKIIETKNLVKAVDLEDGDVGIIASTEDTMDPNMKRYEGMLLMCVQDFSNKDIRSFILLGENRNAHWLERDGLSCPQIVVELLEPGRRVTAII